MLIRKFTLLIAMMLVLALYFWGRNVPETPFFTDVRPAFAQLAFIAWDVLVVGVLVAISGGVGRRILNNTHLSKLSQAEQVALHFGMGLGVISLVVLAMGLVGQYNILMWGIVVLLGVVSVRDVFAWVGDCRAVMSNALSPNTAWQRFIMWYVGILLFLAFLLATAPPFAWDAMTYHLASPDYYLQNGRIIANVNNHFMGFPQMMEVLYGLLMSVGTISAPALLHGFTGVFALMATGGLVARHTDDNTSGLSVLLLISSFSVWLLFGWAYVDLAVMFYGALAIIALTQWRETDATYWLILAGVIAGFGLSIKYTSGLFIIAAGIYILVRQPKNVIRNGVLFGAGVAIVFALWAVKGMVLYGNPVYPYVFGGAGWDELKAANFGASGAGLLSSGIIGQVQIPLLPLTATLFGQERVSPYAATLSPFLLTLPFVLLLGWRQVTEKAKPLTRDLLLLGVPLLLMWMGLAGLSGIGAQPRLMLVGAPVAAILGAIAYHSVGRWLRKPLDMRFILQAVIVIGTIGTSVEMLVAFADTRALQYHTASISEETYLANQDIYFNAMRELDTLPEDSTVLFMWEPKTFYCPADITCITDVLYDNWSHPLRSDDITPQAVMQRWRDDGIDYLLVFGLNTEFEVGYNFWLAAHQFAYDENVVFPTVLNENLQQINESSVYSLYTWKEE